MPFALIWQVLTVAKAFRKPVVLLALFHPEDLYHHFRVYYRCFADAAAILAQTAYSAELFARLVPGARPVQVGPGVDDVVFSQPGISGHRFRAKHGLMGQKVVLYVGRKEPSKRYDLAVQAVDLLRNDDVKLVMIGADIDQQPIDSPRVLYLGSIAREDLLDAYDACDMFLLPSEHESFGMVFLERGCGRSR
jgi:glycosyltransferase involved in cell wall biosynthesis